MNALWKEVNEFCSAGVGALGQKTARIAHVSPDDHKGTTKKTIQDLVQIYQINFMDEKWTEASLAQSPP